MPAHLGLLHDGVAGDDGDGVAVAASGRGSLPTSAGAAPRAGPAAAAPGGSGSMGEDVLRRRSLPPPITRALAHMQPGCAAKPRLARLLRQAERAASSSGGASRRTEDWVVSQAALTASAALAEPDSGSSRGAATACSAGGAAALMEARVHSPCGAPGGPSWLLTSDDSAPEQDPSPGQLPGSVSQVVGVDVATTSIDAGRLTDGGHWGPGQEPSSLLLGGPLPAAVRNAAALQHPSSPAAAAAAVAAAAAAVAAHGMVVEDAQDFGLHGWLHDAPRRSRARLSAGKVAPAPPGAATPQPLQASWARRDAPSLAPARGHSESGLSSQRARGRRATHGPSAVLRARGSVPSGGGLTASGALHVDATGLPPARRSLLPPPGPIPPPPPLTPPSTLPTAQCAGGSSHSMRTGTQHVAAAKRSSPGTNLIEGTSNHLPLTLVDDRTADPLKHGPPAFNLDG